MFLYYSQSLSIMPQNGGHCFEQKSSSYDWKILKNNKFK